MTHNMSMDIFHLIAEACAIVAIVSITLMISALCLAMVYGMWRITRDK